MKVSVLSSLACFFAVSNAQYFSQGWQPGQPTTSTVGSIPKGTPVFQPEGGAQAEKPAAAPGFMDALAQGSVGQLLAKAGINLTAAAAAAATYEDLWDMRVPFIHDDNYDELIVNEPLTPEEEAERTWFLIITTTAGQQQQGGISKLVDREFDAAYNETVIADDLPNVKWGRIDYLNVTYLTTKWNVWRGPFLLVIKDRGQSLRFFSPTQTRVNSTILRTFLKTEGWKHSEPWSSAFAPGGNREFVLHYFALWLRKGYDYIAPIPKFLLMIISGGLGSLVMGLLHRQPKKKEEPKVQKKTVAVSEKPAEASFATASPASAKKNAGKGKKNGKK